MQLREEEYVKSTVKVSNNRLIAGKGEREMLVL